MTSISDPTKSVFAAGSTVTFLAHGNSAAKTDERDGEKDEADGGDNGEASPNNLDSRAAIER
jgi:hypothetical protein